MGLSSFERRSDVECGESRSLKSNMSVKSKEVIISKAVKVQVFKGTWCMAPCFTIHTHSLTHTAHTNDAQPLSLSLSLQTDDILRAVKDSLYHSSNP
ncbi:hypothetical protein L2E82_11025 [Cichorium intybus]|uniref:Uncharacterized protein n=1 Tax=Cichorium intybus TaxID=13427 RepID=A0ACB9GCS4_CICIN|nr:hypothetical protein L2E82_11025 [Cichorium intybus]